MILISPQEPNDRSMLSLHGTNVLPISGTTQLKSVPIAEPRLQTEPKYTRQLPFTAIQCISEAESYGGNFHGSYSRR